MKFHFAATMALLTLSSYAVSAGAQNAETAKSAWKFTDSVGVNIHLHFKDTPYDRFDALVKPKLLESGIRHVRDGAVLTSWQAFYDRHQELGKAGIRCNYVCDPRGIAASRVGEFVTKVGDVESFEGPNELDNRNWNDWLAISYDYQKRLYKTVKADPALSKFPVLGQAFVRGDHFVDAAKYRPEPDAPAFATFADIGNVHAYAAGRPIPDHIKKNLTMSRQLYGNMPIIPTEAGYHNAVKTSSGHKPVSETASGKYIPRLLLEYFNLGLQRTYLYEFIESFNETSKTSDVEQHFGLLRYDGSEKPAFIAVKNLLGLLREDPAPAENFTPGSLEYSLQGAPASVHHTLLQKANGDFYLLLWQDVLVYDTDARQDTPVAPVPVTVTFKQPASVVVNQLSTTQPIATAKETSKLDLQVPDEVVVVRVTPHHG